MNSELVEKPIDTDSNLLQVSEHQDDLNLSVTSLALSEVPSDVIIKTNLIYGNKKSAYIAVLREYCKKTSVHGLNYIFEIHRPLYEKIYWTISIIISLYLAIWYMSATYVKWLNTPTVLGFDETLVEIHKIPFPTVTICPENKRDVGIFNFPEVSDIIWSEIEKHGNFRNRLPFSEQVLQQFLTTLQTCDQEVINRFSPYMTTNMNVSVVENLLSMVTDTDITMQLCKWNGLYNIDCKILKKVITDEGVCHQFNGLQQHDIYKNPNYISYNGDIASNLNHTGNWSLDHGYRGQGFNAYPQRSILSSARNGFYVILETFEDDFDYVCKLFKQGFKVYLNSPESVPLTAGNYILVPNSHEVMVTLLPQYITSEDSLKFFEPEKRQCYFNNERNLYYFKFYTQNNCQTECLTNYTIAKCGCTKFWMPKPLGIPVCDLSKVNCYTSAANELEVIIANQTAKKTKDPLLRIMCDCMPACNSLDYNFEITRAYLDSNATVKAMRAENSNSTTSRLTVYYRERQFTAIKRTVIYDITQLIANCGGIFALFMGVSMLSLIEIIYFFSFYTQNNCQTECLTNYTIAKCGCTKFWMPKPLGIPVCDLSKVNCYTSAANELEVIIANQTAKKTKDPLLRIMCDCMPACNSLDYNFEITRAYLDSNATVKAMRAENSNSTTSRLTVYYRERQFTAIKRTVIYDITQLIANCGGIFALFMGVSMLSLIEIIYFFSVRLFNNFRKRKLIQKKLKRTFRNFHE